MLLSAAQQNESIINISTLFKILFPYRSLQSIDWCSLCYTVGPYQLSILYTVVCICGEGNGTPLQYFAWKIPWTEKPGRLQSMGSRRVGHDWATSLSLFTFMPWRRKWQPTPVFLPGESQGRGSLVAAVCGVTQSRTRLKWLSSSSSMKKRRSFWVLILEGLVGLHWTTQLLRH